MQTIIETELTPRLNDFVEQGVQLPKATLLKRIQPVFPNDLFIFIKSLAFYEVFKDGEGIHLV
jgi:hypothetical protein